MWKEDRKALIHQTKSVLQTLKLDHEEDDEGTSWNKDSRERDPDRMFPYGRGNSQDFLKKQLSLVILVTTAQLVMPINFW